MKPNQKTKIYSVEEAITASVDYFKTDTLAATVFINKYALKNSKGDILENTPEQMHKRIAKEIARIEKKYSNALGEQEIFNLIKGFKYLIPQGSPMTGIGNPFQIASLSNCFVIGNNGQSDSYGAIMKIDQEQVQLMKRRGGVGHDLSQIRPKGSVVKNSALTSTGLVSFMERYSNSTREVAQDGRRGALMLSVSINHPDSEDFIDAKLQEGKITGANISLRIDDDFMKAVIEEQDYTQKYPVFSGNPLFEKKVKASELWKKIIHNAWKSAEPGVLFWDTIIRESIADCYKQQGFKTLSTNPCGEIPLCAYDSCRLLAINLFSYVLDPFTDKATFDFELFKKHVRIAQRIMDDIIDLELEKIDSILDKINQDPEDESIKKIEKDLWLEVRKKAQQGRRTGLGITAEGDMLAALGIRYASEKGIEFCEKVHKTLALAAYASSVEMAKERGAFLIYDSDKEKDNPFIKRIKQADEQLYQDMLVYGRRNIALLTIAPTGSTSIMSQTTSGIEPVFLPVYKRRRKVNPNEKDIRIDFIDQQGDSWQEFVVFHNRFKQWMQINGYDPNKNYSQEEINQLIELSPYYKSSSNDIDWLSKVEMQGAIQKWIDHSISVTINIPNQASQELVNKLYIKAWEVGCKGVTVYRDGSRSGVLISNENNQIQDLGDKQKNIFPTKRPQVLECDIVRFQNNKEKWIAFIGKIDGKPYEIFTGLADDDEGILLPKGINEGFVIKNKDDNGNSRYDFQFINKRGYKTTIEGLSYRFNPEYWNYAKLISSTLRHGMEIEKVVELINSLQLDSESINTWKNGVSRALKKFIPDGTQAIGQKCSFCGSDNIMYQEGCLTCKGCGGSKCS